MEHGINPIVLPAMNIAAMINEKKIRLQALT